MISVMFLCYGDSKGVRQGILDTTLPGWLKQEGVEYEIVVGKGPSIKLPEHPRLRYINIIDAKGNWDSVNIPQSIYCRAHNQLWRACKGEILLTTQADIQVNSPTQLKRMLEKCERTTMVTEKFFKKGARDHGLFLQCCMVYKDAIDMAGGWCELYDNPNIAACEDGDLVATMLEQGMNIAHTETPEEEGVYHIDHPMPDYFTEPFRSRVINGQKLFDSRHKQGLTALYTKQFIRNLMAKRAEMGLRG